MIACMRHQAVFSRIFNRHQFENNAFWVNLAISSFKNLTNILKNTSMKCQNNLLTRPSSRGFLTGTGLRTTN